MSYQENIYDVFDNLLEKYCLSNSIKVDSILKGKILELITCIKFNCKMYEDVNTEFKRNNNMDINDTGFDCIDTENKKCYQCKFYNKGTVNDKSMNQFLSRCLETPNFQHFIVKSEDTRIKCNCKNINIINISNDEIRVLFLIHFVLNYQRQLKMLNMRINKFKLTDLICLNTMIILINALIFYLLVLKIK